MSEQKMPTINQVALTGRLAGEPEFRYTERGVARLRARLSVSRPYQDDDGHWQEDVSFFDIILVKELAEYFVEKLRKETAVFATGRLHSRVWKDGEGSPHTQVEIYVRSLQLLK